MTYNDENKRNFIERFRAERNQSFVSIRAFANRNGIPYYTFRDWYRDERFNPQQEERKLYSTSPVGINIKGKKND